MKMKKLMGAFLAMISAVLVAGTAQAATLAYAADDLFLGFRAAGGSSDYLVNIGQASQFTTTASFTLGLGNLGTDLSSVSLFGSGWATRSDVFWSISGTSGSAAAGGDIARTLYATREQSPVGTQSNPWNHLNSAGQATPTNNMVAMSSAYLTSNSGNSTANSPTGVIQTLPTTNSYDSFTNGSTDFGFFAGSIEGSFANGTAGSVLDLYKLVPGAGSGSIYLGTFSINNSGTVSYVGAAAVPEPSTYAFLILGLVVVGAVVRRQRQLV